MVRAFAGAVALLLGLTLSGSALADGATEDIAKYRHAVMESMAGHMSALALIAQGKVDRGEFAQSHADALASATSEIGSLFPAGSGEGTHARPAVWEDPEDFQAAFNKARDAGAALSKVAAAGDRKATLGAFAALGKSCKGCHETYREEHDH